MRLRTKFAVVLLLVTLVLGTGVYGGLEAYKDRVVGQARSSVAETAGLTADQIDSTIEERSDFVGFMASQPEAARFSRSGAFLDEFLDNSRFYAAQVIAANGTVVDFRGGVTDEVRRRTIGADRSDRVYVRRALEGRVYTAEPELAPARGKYSMIIAAPIFEGRSITGVLAAAIYLDTSTVFAAVAPLETSTQTVSIRGDGTVLYDRHRAFERNITATAAVESTGWVVAVSRDRSALDAQLRDLAIAQGVGLLVVLSFVVGFGIWEYRTMLAQAERLLSAFADLEEGDYSRRLSLSAGEEWEQISDGFNDLVAGLAEREAALREREQRLEVLNRVLRHNVRNDMTVILNYAELIESTAADDELADAARRIHTTGRNLVDLSDKARRIEAAMEAPTTRRVDLVAVTESVVEDLSGRYPGVEIETSLPDSLPVTALPAVELAIENVCENACEHNDADEPRVEVSAETHGGIARLTIADNGPGIPDHEREVLDRGSETSLEHGSGLGLWIVNWVVEQSGGRLSFEETEPRGAAVTLSFRRAGATAGGDGTGT